MRPKSDLIFDKAPIYIKIYDEIKNKIINGNLLPEERLPSENELRKQYKVSRHTVQHAFQLLVSEGLITRRKGLGSFVNPILDSFGTPTKAIILHLGGINEPDAPLTQAHYQFAHRTAELTKNRINVAVHHSSEFGSGNEQIEQLVAMKLDMFGAGVDWIENINPYWGVTNIPFLFRDLDHVKAFISSPINAELKAQVLKQNRIRVIADNWLRPPKVLVSRKPCFDLTDIRGIRFGLPQIPIFHKVWEILGAHPVATAWEKVRELLDSGALDATDVPCDLIYSMGLHLAAPYVTLTQHLYSRACIIMSEGRFETFRPDVQDAILQAGSEVGERYSSKVFDTFINDKKKMIREGARFIEADIEPFRELVIPLAEKIYSKDSMHRELYVRIKEM
jgi:TRAP-type C4-dicarboxylate transport system substrate-binding protein